MPSSKLENNPDEPNLDELISIQVAADISGLSTSYIRVLVRNGMIWGKKLGRNWVTTNAAVSEYQAHKRRPGRPKSSKKT